MIRALRTRLLESWLRRIDRYEARFRRDVVIAEEKLGKLEDLRRRLLELRSSV